jgi:hypothetical protein
MDPPQTDDLQKLKRKRSCYKSQLTLFEKYLYALEDAPSERQVTELQLRISKIQKVFKDFDVIQLEIECASDDVQLEVNERELVESKYYSLLSQAKQMFVNEDHDVERRSIRNCNSQPVKLPTIQLPKFSGSYDTWLEFRDTFLSLIHDNDGIDEINKFHYLRSSLEGSAAPVIKSFEFSAKNYSLAWQLLCERFDNRRLLIQNHVSALFNVEPVIKESSFSIKRMIDQINKNLRALASLGEPVASWDTLLIHIISQKLDTKMYRDWEEHKGTFNKTKSIAFEQFMNFIHNRADLLETLELSRNNPIHTHSGHNSNKTLHNNKVKAMVALPNKTPTTISCPKCRGEHYLNTCSQFLAMSVEDRLSSLSNYKICYNCFRNGHYSNVCNKPGCKICKRKHHSLIHANYLSKPTEGRSSGSDTPSPTKQRADPTDNAHVTLSTNIVAHSVAANSGDVLLSTALIKLTASDNKKHIARALLDSGSSSCLITEKLFNKLCLPYLKITKKIQGINNSLSSISKMCSVAIESLDDSYTTSIQCFVLPVITDNVPARQVDLRNVNIPSNISLADPNFHTPAEIDLIIGADVFWNLLGSDKITLGVGQPTLCSTQLGWLICGPINAGHLPTSYIPICNFTKFDSQSTSSRKSCEDIQNQLARFWQLEEIDHQASTNSQEENACEDYFSQTTTRLTDGRFSVRIPLKESVEMLGESLQRAKRCLLALERRNKSRPLFNEMYKDFMSEYLSLGHMSEYKSSDVNKGYFLPHHGVLRESSTTTKLRVVFNASAPTTSGVSLNNIQMVGPTVQDDLLSILIRYRFHKYVLSADIEKMYRQVSVHESDRHLQQVVWRDDTSKDIKAYQLNTVTYGTASAPFLATRCLKQIGLECKDQQLADVIIHDFYVDDLLTGVDDFSEACSLRDKVTAALASACMPLRKWKSNEASLVSDKLAQSPIDLNIGSTELNKTLGLNWHTMSDTLCFPISLPTKFGTTKRDMLSTTSSVFDPLGLLAPCVIKMKMLLQKLWLEKLSWDEPLPVDTLNVWSSIINTLPLLNQLKIPRRVVCDSYKSLEIHIFADASEKAYGACAYIRTVNDQSVLVRLLMAKSRVAPIKPLTTPRLELCAAVAAGRLYKKISSSLKFKIDNVTFWTDSMIVLGWLKMLPIKLTTFVRNRVSDILENSGSFTWRHVPTPENPADLLSRGADCNDMQSLELWWSGPQFLKQDIAMWPLIPSHQVKLPELKSEVSLQTFHTDTVSNSIIDFARFSSLLRLQRSVAYMFRFINKCKNVFKTASYLTAEELQNSLTFVITQSQRESFIEYDLLANDKPLPRKSSLLKLNPFLDHKKVMRVGGRLSNSLYSFDKKHPIIVQSTHKFVKLLFNFEHKRLMHAGPQLLLYTIRESYWPIGGRNLARACYQQCVLCTRMKGKTLSPQMGNLPLDRFTPAAFPFQNVGVDYAGPLSALSRQGRGSKVVKVYIVVFVCFTTKAIHLELVGDLTSDNYLQALRRFISRRGKPINIYSDNGTSFVGAYNDISKFLKGNCNSLAEDVANEGISFHFIPAYAPHFGGLWEAGVKSTKYHLIRVLGNSHLTYEELNTSLVQIEAILNSRPMTPMSSDPEDYAPITPGHFLIGRPLTSLPVEDLRDCSYTHLTRHKRIEQLRQHFWERWSKEYVSELQQRVKWKQNQDSLQLNTLVVVKDDSLPPLKWKLGRITALHPGADGISRVASIKTATGVIRRAFARICPLITGDLC